MPAPVTLSELIALYLARCRIEGLSPRTQRAYSETLARFQRSVAAQGAPDAAAAVETATVIRYCESFQARRPRHPPSLLPRGALLLQLVRGRQLPRPHAVPRPAQRPPPVGGRTALPPRRARAPGGGVRSRHRRRAARCRRGAALPRHRHPLRRVERARPGRLRPPRGRLLIRHDKGNKQRVVPFARRCQAALEAYLAIRGPTAGPLVWAVTGPGQLRPGVRLQPNGLKQLLRRRGRAAHVPRCHAHRFRHTFATWAIQQDARELDVQHLLGHAGPEMVRRYTASYRAEDAARRHARFSPADQMLRASAFGEPAPR